MPGVRGVQNPFMASLWIGSGAGWPLKGLGVASPDYQVGAHLEALDKGVVVAASKSIETFFATSTFPELWWGEGGVQPKWTSFLLKEYF